jgi:hypothetical protein
MIQGCNFTIQMITDNVDVDIPFSGKTLREKFNVLHEVAAIEGSGQRVAVVEQNGTTGGITTPLTLENVTALFSVVFGKNTDYEFVSETYNLYRFYLDLVPYQDSPQFDLVEKFGSHQNSFLSCFIKSFELRIHRFETIKLHLLLSFTRIVRVLIDSDIKAQNIPIINEVLKRERTEYFSEIGTSYSPCMLQGNINRE